ncbi:MAG: HAD hydrolase-like protein [Candidatus Moranbacteria bacterium]|nr:HAD hydrolase-like protein [Candidatus Moranbacteria bacterium]
MLKKEQIKAVGFDLDQTLYRETKETFESYRKVLYEILAKELKTTRQKAKRDFEKNYKIIGSGTETVRFMGVKEPEKLSAKVPDLAKQHLYITKDPQLVNIIRYLKEKYKLFLITASGKKSSNLKLKALGLSPESDFDYKIFGDEKKSGKTKGLSFSKMVKMTKLKPIEHVYVGDREVTDVVPAKRAGMQTVIVWNKSDKADLALKTIYELDQYL